jgi:hypothetical protein
MRPQALAVLLCLAAPVSATDFYVDPVNGSDAGNGSAANPWRTLQAVIEANLIETQDWESLPYEPGLNLVPVNVGAPVKAGDTLFLRSGYHGEVVIQSAYNASPITIVAEPGQVPLVRSLRVEAAQNWVVRGLSISPSYALPLDQGTIVDVSDDGYLGPAWDVEVDDCDIFTVDDASGWGPDEWVNLTSSGVDVDADRVTIHNSRVRNVRFGIGVSGKDAKIQGNLVDGFSADGLRGLGDNGLFEYNRIQNDYIGDDFDPNHDDGFQSWSVGPGGVGTGQVTGVTLRGNVFINATDPNNPLRNSMQGIGCFDGFFVNWVVENNVVITDHWHGISFYGMRDSRIVNNTVIDLQEGEPGPPWIMVTDHKDGTPSQNVIVRNNLATDYSLEGINVVADHNIEFTHAQAAALFVAPPFDLHLLTGSAALDVGSADQAPPLDVEGIPRPQGAGFDLGAYEKVVAIPVVSIGNCAVVEGNSGSQPCALQVTLSAPPLLQATVSFATANGSASAGTDYTAASGTLTFAPGQTLQTIAVSVQGDVAVEGDEDFAVNLSGLTNATPGNLQGTGTILDDDATSLSANELVHGSSQWDNLAADPGPVADVDLYRLGQRAEASYEVVLDATSGDLWPGLLLERLSADTVSVAQQAAPIGTGSSLSLRFENLVPAPVLGEYVRVSGAACGTTCGAEAVYRLRAYETTYAIPRINNSGTQVTVLVLQNKASYAIGGRIYFRDSAGTPLYTQPFSLASHGLYVLNSASVPGLQGHSGTAAVSNDGRYGDLQGKAIAVEPSTGFTFDTPMTARPR